MNLTKKIFLLGILVIFLSTIFMSFSFLYFLYSKPSNINENLIVYIEKGHSLRFVANELFNQKLITDVDKFVVLARLRNANAKIKAGELLFRKNMTPLEVLDTLMHGTPVTYSMTVPEGYNMYQIALLLHEKGLIDSVEIFMTAARDKNFLHSIGIMADSAEGYLYPDTYSFSRRLPVKEIFKTMYKKYKAVVTKDVVEKAAKLHLSEHEMVTLASIIEKETGVDSERPMISSVFHNRLRKGMKLQTDPTTIYGLGINFNGNLTKENLRQYTPYNTYVINGLPPGPIASPGRDAIVAAINPAKSDYLFFVSRNDGSHFFSENYGEHERAVHKYQQDYFKIKH